MPRIHETARPPSCTTVVFRRDAGVAACNSPWPRHRELGCRIKTQLGHRRSAGAAAVPSAIPYLLCVLAAHRSIVATHRRCQFRVPRAQPALISRLALCVSASAELMYVARERPRSCRDGLARSSSGCCASRRRRCCQRRCCRRRLKGIDVAIATLVRARSAARAVRAR